MKNNADRPTTINKAVTLTLFITLVLTMTALMTSPAQAEEYLDPSKFVIRSTRDPFQPMIPPIGDEKIVPPPPPPVKNKKPNKNITEPKTKTPLDIDHVKPQMERVKSGYVMTGVIATPQGYWAIITGPDKKSHLVRSGYTISDWKVTNITGKSAVLKSEYKFDKLELGADKKFQPER